MATIKPYSQSVVSFVSVALPLGIGLLFAAGCDSRNAAIQAPIAWPTTSNGSSQSSKESNAAIPANLPGFRGASQGPAVPSAGFTPPIVEMTPEELVEHLSNLAGVDPPVVLATCQSLRAGGDPAERFLHQAEEIWNKQLEIADRGLERIAILDGLHSPSAQRIAAQRQRIILAPAQLRLALAMRRADAAGHGQKNKHILLLDPDESAGLNIGVSQNERRWLKVRILSGGTVQVVLKRPDDLIGFWQDIRRETVVDELNFELPLLAGIQRVLVYVPKHQTKPVLCELDWK